MTLVPQDFIPQYLSAPGPYLVPRDLSTKGPEHLRTLVPQDLSTSRSYYLRPLTHKDISTSGKIRFSLSYLFLVPVGGEVRAAWG